MNATARVTILMTPKEKTNLVAQAKRAGCESVSEYLRRKARLPDEFDDPALDALIVEVRASTGRASAALDRALGGMREYEKRWGPEEAIPPAAKAARPSRSARP